MIFSPFCRGLRAMPWTPFCGFTSPFFTSWHFSFWAFKEPFWTGCGGGTGELVVELVVEEGERVAEVVGVLGLGLCSGEATWLVRWVLSSCTGFDVAHEARLGEPSWICQDLCCDSLIKSQNSHDHVLPSLPHAPKEVFVVIHLLLLLQPTFPLGPKPRQAARRAAQAEELPKGPGYDDQDDDGDEVVGDDVHYCGLTFETQCCSKHRSLGSCLSWSNQAKSAPLD